MCLKFTNILCLVAIQSFICVAGFPTCIFYRNSTENGPHSKTSLCKITKFQCSSDIIPPRNEPIEPKIAVCLSEEQRSCMLNWVIENQASETSFYCILAMKEYYFMSPNQSLHCYNVSVEDISSSAAVTVLTQLEPYKGIVTVIETSVTHHSPLDIPAILVGNTVFRTGNGNTCKEKDPCPPGSGLKVGYSRTVCTGDMGRTRVDVSVPGVKVRTVQLIEDSRLIKSCPGILRNCVSVVEKKYGGRFQLKIRLILADNSICEYSKIIPSQICGDPGDLSNSSSLLTNPAADKKATDLPTYAYVLLALACSGVFAVLVTISCIIFQRLRRDGCLRRGHISSLNNQITLGRLYGAEGNCFPCDHKEDNQSDARHSDEEETTEKLPLRDSRDEDDIT